MTASAAKINGTPEHHEFAELFPMLGDHELASLADDIGANGLHEPVWLYEGRILDGRNRWRACELAGIVPSTRQFTGTRIEALAFVRSENLERRHLDSSQRAACAIDWADREAELKAAAAVARKATEGRPKLTQKVESVSAESKNERSADAKLAKEAGTNRTYIAAARKVRAADPKLHEDVKAGNVTLKKAASMIDRAQRQAAASAYVASTAIPSGPFGVLLADPPWRYELNLASSRDPEAHYPTMPLAELMAIDVVGRCAADCVLFLWATSPKLGEAIDLLRAWGFTHKTSAAWVKDKWGCGHYFREQHEFLLVATRGNPGAPPPETRPSSVIEAPRGAHSAKPPIVHETIERMYPSAAKLELFARQARPGWAAWGCDLPVMEDAA